MSAPERSIARILREILDALQDQLRSEIALARQEVTEDLGRAVRRGNSSPAQWRSSAALPAVGARCRCSLPLRGPGHRGRCVARRRAASSGLGRWRRVSATRAHRGHHQNRMAESVVEVEALIGGRAPPSGPPAGAAEGQRRHQRRHMAVAASLAGSSVRDRPRPVGRHRSGTGASPGPERRAERSTRRSAQRAR
jgi:hypothetical protein